ncbi:MAG: porin family protein [Spirochaetaceae bacterium]|nr:porin family protein [Spirochaetaceae bacterium]
MKKCISVLALATIVAGGVFAQEQETTTPAEKKAGLFSAGVGGYITSDFGGGTKSDDGELVVKMPYFGGGGFLFLDATYAELSFGFVGAGGKVTVEMGGVSGDGQDFSLTGLDIGLLGKYPIALGSSLTVFPIFGINYRVIVAAKVDGEAYDPADDFSAFWFKFGGGLDYAIANNIYLRGDLLYGIRLANKVENDMVEGSDDKTRLGHGLDVKLAVGYKL